MLMLLLFCCLSECIGFNLRMQYVRVEDVSSYVVVWLCIACAFVCACVACVYYCVLMYGCDCKYVIVCVCVCVCVCARCLA